MYWFDLFLKSKNSVLNNLDPFLRLVCHQLQLLRIIEKLVLNENVSMLGTHIKTTENLHAVNITIDGE